MANWYGTARSNYVRIIDMDGLRKALEPFPISISPKDDDASLVCFLSADDDSGGWPGSYYVEVKDEKTDEMVEKDVEFDPSVQICPFMAKEEVLVIMETGAEKLRYVTGFAQAYNAKGDTVSLNLNGIYAMAAKKFRVAMTKISPCEY